MKTLKILILFGLTVILFTACQNKLERFTTSSPEIDEVKALLKDYHDGNWEAWKTHYADTAKIYHNTWKNGANTNETIVNFKAFIANTSSYGFDDGEDEIFYEMIIDDDEKKWVNFWGNWKGTLAANNQELEIPVHLSLLMVDGKIVTEYAFYNVAEFTAALQEIEATKMVNEAVTQ